MKKAFIFPGQGSQFVGMAKDLYDSHESARKMFTRANEIMELDLADICFNGPDALLKQTKITQPAIFVHSMIVFDLLKQKGIEAEASAGHSLGEYCALAASGALTYEDGLNLVKIRGSAMQRCGEKNKGTMAAVIGMSMEEIESVCKETGGIVQPANFNSPGQIVISGEVSAVQDAMALAVKKGARKTIELVVSGAFHSPLMEEAREELAGALSKVTLAEASLPVYTNVTAQPETDPLKIRQLLLEQVIQPVRWQETIENMAQAGYTSLYELGPGKVLQGLVKRINRDMDCVAIGDQTSVNSI